MNTRDTLSATGVLSESAAATYVGYSRHYLRVARRYGRGPAYIRVGRSIRYRVQDLDAWLEAHRVEPHDRQAADRAVGL